MAQPSGCDVIGLLYCFASIFVFGLIGWKNYSSLNGQIQQATAWANPPNGAKWVKAKCKAHDTGITDQGGCWHMGPMQDADWLNWGHIKRDPDLPDKWSVCPGVQWCADQGGTCNDCIGGEVMYAVSLLHGNFPYQATQGMAGADWGGEVIGNAAQDILLTSKLPSSDNVTLRNVNGPVQCGHGDKMPFKVDPAPGQTKHCYCTPKSIVDVVKQKGPIHPSGQYCPAVTNNAFQSETKGRRLREFVSPKALNSTMQKWMFPEGYCRSEDVKNSLLNDLYTFNLEYQVYLNWALVEVTREDSSTPVLRCAYEFGAPLASREDTVEVKKIYKAWNSSINQAPMDCYVREGGACGKSSCAVALKNPSMLSENPPGFGPVWPIVWMFVGACPYILCFCLCCVGIAQSRSEAQGQQEAGQGTQDVPLVAA